MTQLALSDRFSSLNTVQTSWSMERLPQVSALLRVEPESGAVPKNATNKRGIGGESATVAGFRFVINVVDSDLGISGLRLRFERAGLQSRRKSDKFNGL